MGKIIKPQRLLDRLLRRCSSKYTIRLSPLKTKRRSNFVKPLFFHPIYSMVSVCTDLRLLTRLTLTVVTVSTSSYAAITATTANIIQGTAPYFLLSDGTKLVTTDQLLGFTLPDGQGGTKQYGYTDSSNVILVPTGTKLNDLVTLFPSSKANTFQKLNDLLNTNFKIGDDDGDSSLSSNTSALGQMRIRLLKNNIGIDTSNELFDKCASYQLKIDIDNTTGTDNVTAQTTYGIPHEKAYTGNTSVSYRLLSENAGLCSIETGSSSYYVQDCGTAVTGTSPSSNGNCKWEGGYNPAVFDGRVFSVDDLRAIGKEFPTTGFQNARLIFIGPRQIPRILSFYKCEVTGSWVSVSGPDGCNLSYEISGRPTTDITIKLKTDDSVGTVLDTYIIKAPASGSWAENSEPLNSFTYHDGITFDAASYCAGKTITNSTDAAQYFFSPAKITNAPNIDSEDGRFSRDADGTFMGEWGAIANGYSEQSPWYGGLFWAVNENNVFVVQQDGSSMMIYPDDSLQVVCKR